MDQKSKKTNKQQLDQVIEAIYTRAKNTQNAPKFGVIADLLTHRAK
jgi:hypothetical protein